MRGSLSRVLQARRPWGKAEEAHSFCLPFSRQNRSEKRQVHPPGDEGAGCAGDVPKEPPKGGPSYQVPFQQ